MRTVPFREAAIVEQTLTQDVRALLESLLTQEPLEGTSVPGKTSAYKLTLMQSVLRLPQVPAGCQLDQMRSVPIDQAARQ